MTINLLYFTVTIEKVQRTVKKALHEKQQRQLHENQKAKVHEYRNVI